MVQEKLVVLNKAGLSKDDFKDAEAIAFGKDLDWINGSQVASSQSKCSQQSQQKGIQEYFTKTPEEVVVTKFSSEDNNVFGMSPEDDAILLEFMSDW